MFDRAEWEAKIRDPLWHRSVPEIIERMTALRGRDKAASDALKEDIYSFFESKLREGSVALGASGKDWDAERRPIDTVVIHHTSNPAGMSAERLSAIELVRLYAPAYAKRTKKEGVYSAHFREDAQVFYPYHWFVRSGGNVERLLLDSETGWHAGDWDINCRSVAICIDDDHEDSGPDEATLQAIARLIREKYPQVSKERIFGHREINPRTTCPSELFLSAPGRKGWKETLLEMI